MNQFEHFVQRLRDEPGLSRNRNYEELSQPEARRARRLLKRLAGIARELDGGGTATLEGYAGGYLVTIDFPSVRASHQAFLTAEEHGLMMRDEKLAARLQKRS